MRPGDFLVIEGHPFRLEAFQDGGEAIFIRIEQGEGFEAGKAWLEQLAASGAWVELGKPYGATEARVLDMRVAQNGTLRARLEFRVMWDAPLAWPP